MCLNAEFKEVLGGHIRIDNELRIYLSNVAASFLGGVALVSFSYNEDEEIIRLSPADPSPEQRSSLPWLKVYKLQKCGSGSGFRINIPKKVVTKLGMSAEGHGRNSYEAELVDLDEHSSCLDIYLRHPVLD